MGEEGRTQHCWPCQARHLLSPGQGSWQWEGVRAGRWEWGRYIVGQVPGPNARSAPSLSHPGQGHVERPLAGFSLVFSGDSSL